MTLTNSDATLIVAIDRFAYPSAEHPVIEALRFDAEPGEFVAVLGPSGCGKTSLLNLLAGLSPEYRGTLSWRGQSLGDRPDGIGLGCMFQEPRLMPWLTVAENIELVLTDADPGPRVARLLEAVGLSDQGSTYPNQLSGGMRRRVALARAFAVAPKLLLMDEPFVSLDAPTANRLRELLIDLWQGTDATVILVTHDLREAVALADRLVFLSPRPARVVLETPVDLPRPRQGEDAAVSEFCRALLDRHPDLLAGTHDPSKNA